MRLFSIWSQKNHSTAVKASKREMIGARNFNEATIRDAFRYPRATPRTGSTSPLTANTGRLNRAGILDRSEWVVRLHRRRRRRSVPANLIGNRVVQSHASLLLSCKLVQL